MNFKNDKAGLFVPDGTPMPQALARTTHMAIGAHPDDQEFLALHGILECFGKSDKWFSGVCVTDGAGSSRTGPYADYTNEEMMQVRYREQRKAAAVGEYACEIQLEYSSSQVKDASIPDVTDDLTTILQEATPEVVYIHNPADKHDTHVATMLRSITALRRLPADERPRNVYGPELWRSLDWMNDDDKTVLPISGRSNLHFALAGIFDSQISGGKRYDVAVDARRRSNATMFESHAADRGDCLQWAVDLTPLMSDDSLSAEDHVLSFIDRFRADVADRISRMG